MVWPTLGSRTAKEQNRTEQIWRGVFNPKTHAYTNIAKRYESKYQIRLGSTLFSKDCLIAEQQLILIIHMSLLFMSYAFH